jgi:hypothetical protein
MNRRRLEALRNLAERPGTEAEGQLAREILKRAEAEPSEANPLGRFAQFMRSGSMDDLRDAVGPKTCDCGTQHPAFTSCPNTAKHADIDAERRARFPRGTRVYYNCWAYSENCAGRVTGYPAQWNWIRVKFDHLKSSRSVPIYSALGWHLSTEPLPREKARPLRGGMHTFDGTGDVVAGEAAEGGA